MEKLKDVLYNATKDSIMYTLKYTKGHRAKAANILGVSARSLRYYLKKYRDQGIYIPDSPEMSYETAIKGQINAKHRRSLSPPPLYKR